MPNSSFTVSPNKVFTLLKDMVASEPSFTITECDNDSLYLKVEVEPHNFSGQDAMDFLVKGVDKVVIFKSYENESASISDFGACKNQVDKLREKSAGVFSAMGGGGITSDTYDGGAAGKHNGAFG